MPDMDQGIKRLLQTHPADVLALAVPEAEYLGTMPVDLATEPQLVLDTLLHVRYAGTEAAVDLEAEARPRPEMGRRCFEYGARASIITELPVISVVLWLEAGSPPPTSPYELTLGDRLLATWHFVGIELYKLRAQALIERGLMGLLPLVPFTQDGNDLQTIERTATIVKEQAVPDEVEELEALLAVFGTRRFGVEAMRAIIRRLFMSTEILETSALYQEAIQKGKAQGIEQGKAQGIEQGIEQGMRDALLFALRGRFGTLEPEVERAVAAANGDVVRDALAHVGTDSFDEARARLGRQRG